MLHFNHGGADIHLGMRGMEEGELKLCKEEQQVARTLCTELAGQYFLPTLCQKLSLHLPK